MSSVAVLCITLPLQRQIDPNTEY